MPLLIDASRIRVIKEGAMYSGNDGRPAQTILNWTQSKPCSLTASNTPSTVGRENVLAKIPSLITHLLSHRPMRSRLQSRQSARSPPGLVWRLYHPRRLRHAEALGAELCLQSPRFAACRHVHPHRVPGGTGHHAPRSIPPHWNVDTRGL